ncbi:Multidrug resistance protein Stp [Baekduia alba]|uniref:MFS transporter n=1 Tax=Baekduia alba TaxID=2997333 RepID=UPI0023414B22|nr:MFS transporter [Baekduia alba]WCB96795.1 Multidrug resistance protein Stp [Baekduia alba]
MSVQPDSPPDPHRWWTLGAVCVATFMLLLDVTIVNVALPDIQRDLDSSFQDLQWVVDAYALTLAAFLLTAGSLADRVGRKRVFVAGLVLFTIASLLCGLSKSPTTLNLARALQGVGGAAMFATSLALLASAFTGRERGTALGIWGATTGASVAVGPLVGGVLTEHVSWQSIFFVNLPIGLAAIAVTLRLVTESRSPDPDPIDWAGLVTFSTGLFALVFALVRGNSEGWSSGQIVGLLVAAAVLLIAFVVIESRRRRPMLDLSLFRKPTFVGVSIVAFALSASIFAMFLYLTLFMQNILGYSPLEAGLRFLPITVVSFFCAALSGNLTERVPVRLLLGAGLGLIGIGLLLMSGLDADSEWTALLPGFLLAGAGVGLTNPAIASTAVGVVDPRRAGMASGVNSTFRQVGIATGIAGLGAIFQSTVSSKILDAMRDSGAQRPPGAKLPPSEALAQGDPRVLGPLHDQFVTGWTSALNEILVIAGVVALVGAVLALILVRSQDFVAHGAPAPATPQPEPAAR